MEVIANMQKQIVKLTTERETYLEQLMELKDNIANEMDEKTSLHNDLMLIQREIDVGRESLKK